MFSQTSKFQSVCVRLYPVPEMLQKQLHLCSFREANFVWKAFFPHKAGERTNGWMITEKDVAEEAVIIFTVSRRVQLFFLPKWPTVNLPCLYCADLLACSLKRRRRIFRLVVRGMWSCLLKPCLDFTRFCSENLQGVYPMFPYMKDLLSPFSCETLTVSLDSSSLHFRLTYKLQTLLPMHE